jgi:hypothetical protein
MISHTYTLYTEVLSAKASCIECVDHHVGVIPSHQQNVLGTFEAQVVATV